MRIFTVSVVMISVVEISSGFTAGSAVNYGSSDGGIGAGSVGITSVSGAKTVSMSSEISVCAIDAGSSKESLPGFVLPQP